MCSLMLNELVGKEGDKDNQKYQTVIWWENDRKKEKHSQVVQVMGLWTTTECLILLCCGQERKACIATLNTL
jgi:hypothetical protein